MDGGPRPTTSTPSGVTQTDDPTSLITSSASLIIPYFTAPPGCLDTTNIWLENRWCFSGSGIGGSPQTCSYFNLDYFGLGYNTNILPDKTCKPGDSHDYPATQCPSAYAAVATVNRKYVGYNRRTGTRRTIFCCPTYVCIRLPWLQKKKIFLSSAENQKL